MRTDNTRLDDIYGAEVARAVIYLAISVAVGSLLGGGLIA